MQADVSARIQQRSEALASRLRAVRALLNSHLMHGDTSAFTPAVLATSSAGESEAGDLHAPHGRSSALSTLGTREDRSHLVIVPRTRDVDPDGTYSPSSYCVRTRCHVHEKATAEWMCDRIAERVDGQSYYPSEQCLNRNVLHSCLLYTSDAADE